MPLAFILLLKILNIFKYSLYFDINLNHGDKIHIFSSKVYLHPG